MHSRSSAWKSRGNKRNNLNGTNGAKFAVFFADFRWLFLFCRFLGITAFRRRRFLQKTADFCRKPQETADFRRNPFVPFSSSLLIPTKKFHFPTTQKNHIRLKFPIPVWDFHYRLKISIPGLVLLQPERGSDSRLNISFRIESLIFQYRLSRLKNSNPWALWVRPIIIKPVGGIFQISDSNPIRGKCGKCGLSLSSQKKKKQGFENMPQSETQRALSY